MNLLNILKTKFFTLLSGLLLALLSAMVPAFAGTPINKTVPATANGDVNISSVAGNIKITTWDHNRIHVGGTLSSEAKRLEVQKTETGVTIRVMLPHNTYGNFEGSHLVVQLPAASHLRVGTVSANISATGLTGSLKVDTVSGEIKLQSKSANLKAKSVSGNINVTGSARNADIHANSISGEVNIKNIHGELRGETVSGDIEIDGSNTLSGAKLDTTSGDIEMSAALGANGDYEFNSVSGDVKLRLPSIPRASFDASSLSGGIMVNFGPAPQRTSEYGPGKEWHYQSGSGKAEIRIHTMSGDIRIHISAH